ncbi:MAG: hypothetical protein HGA85_02650 [Nanoarchaeota archaeon]|nr:hypothetical protein [Nanoarchaeota archaeon]
MVLEDRLEEIITSTDLDALKSNLNPIFPPGLSMKDFIRLLGEEIKAMNIDYAVPEDGSVFGETGLPGTKLVCGNQTIYVHGLVHPGGGILERHKFSKSRYFSYVQDWIMQTDNTFKGTAVVLEEGLKNTFKSPKGYAPQHFQVLFDIYGNLTLTNILKTKAQLFLHSKKDAMADSVLFGGIDDLIVLRKHFNKAIRPLYDLATEFRFREVGLPPYVVIGGGISLYLAGRAYSQNIEASTVHYVTGYIHEAQILGSYECDGPRFPACGGIAKSTVEERRDRLIKHMAKKSVDLYKKTKLS